MEQLLQTAAVGGTIALLWLTLEGLRRLRVSKGARNPVSVQQRISLVNGCQLVLVHWNGRELLLAAGNLPCTVLADKPLPTSGGAEEARGAWAH